MGFLELEPGCTQCSMNVRDTGNIGQAVPGHDVVLDPLVLGIARIDPVGEAPLVACKTGSRPQHAKNLPEQRRLVGCVHRRLDGKCSVVAIVPFWNPHVVTLNEATQRADVPCLQFGALDLVGVVVDANDAGPGTARQVAHWSADPAPDIDDFRPGFQGQPVGDALLVPEQRRLEAFAATPGREVKALAPAELVEVGRQVVVVIY